MLAVSDHSRAVHIAHEIIAIQSQSSQLSSKEETLPTQASLYTLPSMQFLESLLDEMDSRSASAGTRPAEPPLYLPVDSFDLPGLDGPGSSINDLTQLGLPPLRNHRPAASAPPGTGALMVPNPSFGQHMPLPPFGGDNPFAPTAGSAAPSPQKNGARPVGRPPGPAALARRAASALEDMYELDDLEVSLQASRCGRIRKVTSFSGKRKASDMLSQVSAPAAMVAPPSPSRSNGVTDSGMSAFTEGMDDDEVSKGSRRCSKSGKKGRRTVCLNCGSYQTPQWRCGPLGPRTLCNACGVRYKKGLPLNCWPIRDGMVLPPGAVLPPTVCVPPGINIITSALDIE